MVQTFLCSLIPGGFFSPDSCLLSPEPYINFNLKFWEFKEKFIANKCFIRDIQKNNDVIIIIMKQIPILISASKIDKKINSLAKNIVKDNQNTKILYCITVLNSAKKFSCKLRHEIKKYATIKIKNHNITLSSYGSKKVSSGKIIVKKDIKANLKDKNILIIEDMVDTGCTLKFLKTYLFDYKKVNSVKIATLLVKKKGGKPAIKPEYNGFKINDEFVVGYGIDYQEQYRNLKYLGYIK